MNGERSNKLSRKQFLQICGLALLSPYIGCNKPSSTFIPQINDKASGTGHLLRTKNFPPVSETKEIDTLIIGGGISGMSAARWLKRNGIEDFLLMELDSEVGGNSKGGENQVSKYPFAAHYLPIPNTDFTELIDFLRQHEVLSFPHSNQYPTYNEYYLCFEPEERLFYRGVWIEGLPPKTGLLQEDQAELERFLGEVAKMKLLIGSDGKPAFTIPLEHCSKDELFRRLDLITVTEYLEQNDYRSEFLKWYLDYCCKDDYGTSMHNTSAWAALHYFCSRTGKASNAESFDVLTWPEGNNFLAKKLESECRDQIRKEMLAYKVEKVNDKWNCSIYDIKEKKSVLYSCRSVILASPQFVNRNILVTEQKIDWSKFHYYPWIVANITIKDKYRLDGREELCWDNVIHNSNSLGYVNANHQDVDRAKEKIVITYYYNFSEKSAKEERSGVYEKDADYWKEMIVADLKKAHPGIEELIADMEINVLGHGMISPTVGFLSDPSRRILEEGFDGLYFAHSDVSGISIFEQAFYRGIVAAKQSMKKDGSKS